MAAVRRSLALSALLLLPASTAAQTSDIADLDWMQGCWIHDTGEWIIEEQWMAPRGDALVGMSRTSLRDSLRNYELVVIRADTSGIRFEAHPSGQASAVFHSVEQRPDRIVFENPGHDFPQRIGYEADGPDRLTGWIEGLEKGEHRRIEFPYVRAVCTDT